MFYLLTYLLTYLVYSSALVGAMQRHTTMHAAYGTSLRDCEERNLSVESMTSREIKFYAYFLYSNRSGDGDSCICIVVSSNITNYMYSKAPTF